MPPPNTRVQPKRMRVPLSHKPLGGLNE